MLLGELGLPRNEKHDLCQSLGGLLVKSHCVEQTASVFCFTVTDEKRVVQA